MTLQQTILEFLREKQHFFNESKDQNKFAFVFKKL